MTGNDPTERGRVRVSGFDQSQVERREPLSDWTAERTGETRGGWARAWTRFRRNRAALAGLLIVGVLSLLAILARPIAVAGITVQPFAIAPYDPTTILYLQPGSSVEVYDPPSLAHPMGVDGSGRDLLSRVLYGGRYSISIGFVVVTLSASVGLVSGAVAGYYGGWVDEVLMRIVDTVYAFPALVLALVIVATLGGGYWQLVLAFAVPGWVTYARLVRGEVLTITETEYVLAAKAVGARDRSVIRRHIVPNAIPPLIVVATLNVGTVVIGVAALGFLGLGLPPGTAEWGTMLDQTRETLIQGPDGTIPWWATVVPGGAIFLFVLAMNLIGDGLNDALAVRESGVERRRRRGER